MATKEIAYRSRTLQYTYDPAAAWTDLDQQLADALYGEVEMDMRHEADVQALMDRAAALSRKLEALSERTTEVRTLLRKAQTTASEFVGMLRLGKQGMEDDFAEAVNNASEALHERHEELSALHKVYEPLCDEHKEIVDRMDQEGEAWDDKMQELIKKACETDGLATDAVSFDSAYEELLGMMAVHHDHRKDQLQFILDVLREYELQQERARGQQEVWEEFCERLKMIEMLGHDMSGVVQIGMN